MEKQDTLRNLLVAAAVFMLALTILPTLFPTRPPAIPPGETPAEQTAPAESTATAPPTGAAPDSGFHVHEADVEAVLEIGAMLPSSEGYAEPPPYRLHATLSSAGASTSSVLLADHAERIRDAERYALLSPVTRLDGVIKRSFAIEKINVDGQDIVLEDKQWIAGSVEEVTGVFPGMPPDTRGQRVVFSLEISAAEQPALRLTRTYLLPAQPIATGRHDMWADLTVENLSDRPRRLVVAYRGAIHVPKVEGQYAGPFIDVGVRDASGYVVGARKNGPDVANAPGGRLSLFRQSPETINQRLSWASLNNTYFAATIAPVDADGRSPAANIAEVAAVDFDGSPETTHDVALTFATVAQELPPAGRLTYRTDLYLGEKDRKAFHEIEPYVSRNYYFQIGASLPWCTLTWLVELMTWLLNGLYAVFRDFGIAIIILVLIVRALLHPITKKGQVNMVRMQQRMSDFAPKMEELKKRFGNDKVRLQQETMSLYREHGINPAGQLLTCLPMMLQIPIWAALFYSLSNNVLMRHEPLHFTWIRDLTAPDMLVAFSSPWRIPVFGWKLDGFHLLPLLVALFMYIQQKTMPKPEPNPNMTEQQKMQQDMMQKMMIITPIMMLLFFYNMPSGLNLYIMFSSLFGWLEQKRIRSHIKVQTAAGTLLKPKPAAPARQGAPAAPGGAGESAPARKLPGWLEKLQKAAEDAQKSQRTQRRDNKPKRKR